MREMLVVTRKKRITLLIVALAAFLWIAHSSYRSLSRQKEEQSALPPLTIGMTVPEDYALESLDAKKVSLSSFHGKVVLLNFWAGWCAPCLHEMPGLYELQKKLEGRGFVVLGINMDDKPEAGMAVLKRTAGDAPFALFRGLNAPLADRFNIDGLPFTVVLDRTFKIVYAHPGEVDWAGADARRLIEGLL